jgi:hypothetical protein
MNKLVRRWQNGAFSTINMDIFWDSTPAPTLTKQAASVYLVRFYDTTYRQSSRNRYDVTSRFDVVRSDEQQTNGVL